MGFECLYWIPYLSHLLSQARIDPSRLVIVTRGGAAAWYGPSCRAVELFDYLPVAEVRRALLAAFTATGSMKQTGVTPFERDFLALTATRLGITRYHVLHPSEMYRDLQPWWSLHMSVHDLMQRVTFRPLAVPQVPLAIALPEGPFIAVKFYSRPTWPATEALRDFAQDLVIKLAKKAPVVLLDAGFHADDHAGVPIGLSDRVMSLAGQMTPQNNLAVQSAVLSKARAFVGTYGGTMQLAVRLGLPAAGFYDSFTGTAYAHKLLTEILGMQQATPVFIGRPTDASFVDQVVG